MSIAIRPWPRTLVSAAFVATLLGVQGAPVSASTTYTWTNQNGNHSWNTAKNWDPEGKPDSGDSIDVPGNKGDVRDVPTIDLEQVSLGKNSYLYIDDNLVTTQLLNWNGGTIYGSMSVSGTSTISDPSDAATILDGGASTSPPTLTFSGPTVLTGNLTLNGPVTVDNVGTFTNLLGTVGGQVCCVNPAVFDNEGTLIGGELDNLRYKGEAAATAQGNTLLKAGSHVLKNGTHIGANSTLDVVDADLAINGTLRLGAGAKLIQGGPLPGDRTNVTGTFTLKGPASGANATWEWQGGTTYASMTLGTTAGLSLRTAAFKQLNGASGALGIGLLTVPAGATVTQNTSALNLAGTIANHGTWKVRAGQAGAINGNGVTRPFRDFGVVDATGASLTVTNARVELDRDPALSATGSMTGGDIVLMDGELGITNGARISGSGAEVKLDGGLEVTGGGTLNLANGAVVNGRNATVLAPLKVRGSGQWAFGSGYLSADIDFGTNVTFRIYQPTSAPTDKHVQQQNGQGVTVTSRGTALQSGEVVNLVPGSKVINLGNWTITHGGFVGNSVGAQFINGKTLTVDIGGPAVGGLFTTQLLQKGDFTVNAGSSFTVGANSQQTAGTTDVKGTLTPSPGYRVTAGVLTGGGTVAGSIRNSGQLLPGDGIGTLTISGAYSQTASGDLRLDLRNNNSDRLVVGGAAALGGTLHLLLRQSGALSSHARTLVSAASVTGHPAVTFGSLPAANWRVVISSNAVRLIPR